MYISFNGQPKPGSEPVSHRYYDEGNWRYNGKHRNVFAYQDEGEQVTVWVAEKPRQAVLEVSEPSYKLGSRFIPVIA
jgi:hypothetical protein